MDGTIRDNIAAMVEVLEKDHLPEEQILFELKEMLATPDESVSAAIPEGAFRLLSTEIQAERNTGSDCIILFRVRFQDCERATAGWVVRHKCLNADTRVHFWHDDIETAIDHYRQA